MGKKAPTMTEPATIAIFYTWQNKQTNKQTNNQKNTGKSDLRMGLMV